MFHVQSSVLDPPHPALLTRTPSLLFPSHGDMPCDPRRAAQSGRLTGQSPFAGCEPDGHIESVQFGGGAYNLPKEDQAELRPTL